jgi:hypothetical protein
MKSGKKIDVITLDCEELRLKEEPKDSSESSSSKGVADESDNVTDSTSPCTSSNPDMGGNLLLNSTGNYLRAIKSINNISNDVEDHDKNEEDLLVAKEFKKKVTFDESLLHHRKRVTFSNVVRVVLIPTRREFRHIHPQLFYSREECDHFKMDAMIELEQFRVSSECIKKRAILMSLGLWCNVQDFNDFNITTDSVRMRDSTPSNEWEYKWFDGPQCICQSEPVRTVFNFKTEAEQLSYPPFSEYSIELIDPLPPPYCGMREACMILYQTWSVLGEN